MDRSPRLLKIALACSGLALALLGAVALMALGAPPRFGTATTPVSTGGAGPSSGPSPTTQPILLTIEAHLRTPTPTVGPTATAKPTPADWCDPDTPEPGTRCTWPNLTPPAVVTPEPPKPTATVQACGPGAASGRVCVWLVGGTASTATPSGWTTGTGGATIGDEST